MNDVIEGFDGYEERPTIPAPHAEESAREIYAANASLCTLAQIALGRYGEPSTWEVAA